MNRFFLSLNCFQKNKILFPSEVSHQILNVLRLREGDQVQVLDNQGSVFDVVLDKDQGDGCLIGRIRATNQEEAEPKTRIALHFGLTSREKVEWILQKGTEIGVASFHPYVSSRTMVQSTEMTQQRRLRWEKILREAAEQSHRGLLPELSTPMTFQQTLALAAEENDICLIAWEGASPVEDAIRGVLDHQRGRAGKMALLVGPEGGFSNEEIEKAQSCGCRVVSLGKGIMRMETAAIVFPALVLYELETCLHENIY